MFAQTGITAAAAVGIIRRTLQNAGYRPTTRRLLRVGHGGTLDRAAEGVLVLGVGREGCRRLATELAGSKHYRVDGLMGTETDTLDATGAPVCTQPWAHVTRPAMEAALAEFVPGYEQTAPLYSALKVDGKRMSDRVRQGEIVPPKTRPVLIPEATCVALDGPAFTLHVHCGGGTYMRSLVRDLAGRLGTCAHMVSLCRLQQGTFDLEHSLPVGAKEEEEEEEDAEEEEEEEEDAE